MAYEHIQVTANGYTYDDWESVTIVAELSVHYVTAILTTTEIGGTKDWLNPTFSEWHFPPGTPVTIIASGTPIFVGIVDIYEPAVDEMTHRITLTVRGLAKDFALTSVFHPTGNYEAMTDVGIIGQWAGLMAIPLKILTTPVLIPYWQIRQGASPYAEAMRMLRGKLLFGDMTTGGMVVSDGPPSGAVTDGMILQGVNVTKMSARLSDEEQHTLLEVVGSSPDGTDVRQHLEPFGLVYNPFGADYLNPLQFRYKKIIDQGATTSDLAMIRARFAMSRNLGKRLRASFTLPGWRTGGVPGQGPVWEPNWDVNVRAPYLKIDCNLRIFKVILQQDSGATGTTATVFVTDAQAFNGPPSQCVGDRALWDIYISDPSFKPPPGAR